MYWPDLKSQKEPTYPLAESPTNLGVQKLKGEELLLKRNCQGKREVGILPFKKKIVKRRATGVGKRISCSVSNAKKGTWEKKRGTLYQKKEIQQVINRGEKRTQETTST